MPSPPSSPSLSNPTAVVGRRIGAFLIDGLIGVTLIFVFALATFTNTELGDSLTAELQCEVINEFSNDLCIQAGTTVYVGAENEVAIITLIWLAWVLISTMILPGVTGWSPGKLLTGIRVVKADTFEKAGLGANILRGVLWVVDAFPYVAPIVGTLLASKDRRRVGDRAANTLVVRADSVGRPPVQTPSAIVAPPTGAVMPSTTPPPPSGPPATTLVTASPPPATTPPPPTSPAPPTSPPPPGSPAPPSASAPTGPPSAYQPPPPSEYRTEPAPSAPPVFPPPAAPPVFPPTEDAAPADPIPVVEPEPEAEAEPAPEAEAAPIVEAEPAATPEPEPEPVPESPAETSPRPGVDAPMWDDARNTYIQWDPELTEWMEWSEAQGRWIPISR